MNFMEHNTSTRQRVGRKHPALHSGDKIGRLTLVLFVREGKTSYWFCLCECGMTTKTESSHIRSGSAQSCGCLARERSSQRARIHGYSGNDNSHEYATWHSMRSRCLSTTHSQFAEYGGRGIRICPRWNEFVNFLADMGKRPSPDHSLDRFPNNDGHYEPSNCRWATRKQQQRNRRVTVFLTINNKRKALTEWCDLYGKSPDLVRSRLYRGWATERALTAPVQSGGTL